MNFDLINVGYVAIPMPDVDQNVDQIDATMKSGSSFSVGIMRPKLLSQSGDVLHEIFKKMVSDLTLDQYDNNHGIERHLSAIERYQQILPLNKIFEALFVLAEENQKSEIRIDYARGVTRKDSQNQDISLDVALVTFVVNRNALYADMQMQIERLANLIGKSVGLTAYQLSRPSAIENVFIALRYLSEQEITGAFTAANVLQTYMVFVMVALVAPGMIIGIIKDHPTLQYSWLNQLNVMGIMVAAMAMGILSFKFYKVIWPLPNQIKPMINFTAAAKDGKIEPLLFRDAIIRKVFKCWQVSNTEHRQHPLLVGPPGAGKSLILMELARKIILEHVPAGLKKEMHGIKMFGGPASLFIVNNSMMESDDKLEQFLRVVDSHKDKIILALDEIHVLLNEKYGPRYSDVLKSILDTSLRGLPYFIGATTRGEYDRYISGTPLERRFKVIDVPFLNEEDVITSLRNMMRHHPGIYTDGADFEKIYQAGEKLIRDFPHLPLSQPEIAKRILNVANAAILSMQDEVDETDALIKFHRVAKEIGRCNEEMIQLAARINDGKERQEHRVGCRKKFYLMSRYLIPQLRRLHKDLCNHLKIPVLAAKIESARKEVITSLGIVENMAQKGVIALHNFARELQERADRLEELDECSENHLLSTFSRHLHDWSQAFLSQTVADQMREIIKDLQESIQDTQKEAGTFQKLANAVQQTVVAIDQFETPLNKMASKFEKMGKKYPQYKAVLDEAFQQFKVTDLLVKMRDHLTQGVSALQQVSSKPQPAAIALYSTANAFTFVLEAFSSLSEKCGQAEQVLKTLKRIDLPLIRKGTDGLQSLANLLQNLAHGIEQRVSEHMQIESFGQGIPSLISEALQQELLKVKDVVSHLPIIPIKRNFQEAGRSGQTEASQLPQIHHVLQESGWAIDQFKHALEQIGCFLEELAQKVPNHQKVLFEASGKLKNLDFLTKQQQSLIQCIDALKLASEDSQRLPNALSQTTNAWQNMDRGLQRIIDMLSQVAYETAKKGI